MQKYLQVFIFLLTVLLTGCVETQPVLTEVRPAARPVRKASDAAVRQKFSRLQTLLAPLKIRGAGISWRAFAGGYTPAEVCRFISNCGFNRIYIHVSSGTELDSGMIAFLKSVKAQKLTAEIVLKQGDFRQPYRGNNLIRSRVEKADDVPGMVKKIMAFNAALPADAEKISGIVLAAEAHKFTRDAQGTTGQFFAWSEKTFGPGLDNDMLMQQALELVKKLNAQNIKVTSAIPDFYHDLAEQGKLSCGKVSDFTALCLKSNEIILQSTASIPTAVVAGTRGELNSFPAGKNMILGLEIAGHTAVSSGKLRRRDWKDLSAILDYVIREHKKYPEFQGIMLSPLSVLNHLIMEQD